MAQILLGELLRLKATILRFFIVLDKAQDSPDKPRFAIAPKWQLLLCSQAVQISRISFQLVVLHRYLLGFKFLLNFWIAKLPIIPGSRARGWKFLQRKKKRFSGRQPVRCPKPVFFGGRQPSSAVLFIGVLVVAFWWCCDVAWCDVMWLDERWSDGMGCDAMCQWCNLIRPDGMGWHVMWLCDRHPWDIYFFMCGAPSWDAKDNDCHGDGTEKFLRPWDAKTTTRPQLGTRKSKAAW